MIWSSGWFVSSWGLGIASTFQSGKLLPISNKKLLNLNKYLLLFFSLLYFLEWELAFSQVSLILVASSTILYLRLFIILQSIQDHPQKCKTTIHTKVCPVILVYIVPTQTRRSGSHAQSCRGSRPAWASCPPWHWAPAGSGREQQPGQHGLCWCWSGGGWWPGHMWGGTPGWCSHMPGLSSTLWLGEAW